MRDGKGKRESLVRVCWERHQVFHRSSAVFLDTMLARATGPQISTAEVERVDAPFDIDTSRRRSTSGKVTQKHSAGGA